METDPDRILSNLHVISLLSPSDKLITNDDRFDIHAPSALREIYRTWHGEKRSNNMLRVRQTLHSAMTCVNRGVWPPEAVQHDAVPDGVRLHREAVQHVRMCEGLAAACVGLSHLRQTYRDDATTASQIDTAVTEVRDFLAILRPRTERLRALVSQAHRDDATFTPPLAARGWAPGTA